MTINQLFVQHTNSDSMRVMPNRVQPISHVPLGEATDLCRTYKSNQGKIPEETFQKIRTHRARMAAWDKKWGRG